MIQPNPDGQVEEAPAEQAPAFDPVLVRDFFNFLEVGLYAGEPESAKVASWPETAALGRMYGGKSGSLVIVTAVSPTCHAIRMARYIQKMATGADWEVLNLDHLLAVAEVASALVKLGNLLMKLRQLLKSFKDKGEDVGTELGPLFQSLDVATSAADEAVSGVLGVLDVLGAAFTSPEMVGFSNAARAVVEQAKKALMTVREAAGFDDFVRLKPLHGVVKKACRGLGTFVNATPIDLPEANLFNV